MQRIILVYGLMSGLIVSAIMAISMLTFADHGTGSMIVGYLSMLIAFAQIFVAVKTYREKHQNGTISFGKAFLIGLFIALIASTLYLITWAFVYHNYMPDFMDKYTAQMLEQEKATATPAQLQAKVKEMNEFKEQYKNPFFFALMTYAEILPVGLIVSLITALILKRKK